MLTMLINPAKPKHFVRLGHPNSNSFISSSIAGRGLGDPHDVCDLSTDQYTYVDAFPDYDPCLYIAKI